MQQLGYVRKAGEADDDALFVVAINDRRIGHQHRGDTGLALLHVREGKRRSGTRARPDQARILVRKETGLDRPKQEERRYHEYQRLQRQQARVTQRPIQRALVDAQHAVVETRERVA